MADTNDDAEKRDEEQEVRDADADTRDTDDSEKRDEEQEVRDTDTDTKDVTSKLDKMWDMMQRMSGTLDKLVSAQSVLVESGAIYDVGDEPEDDGVSSASDSVTGILDLSI